MDYYSIRISTYSDGHCSPTYSATRLLVAVFENTTYVFSTEMTVFERTKNIA